MFQKPAWCGWEVTADERLKNSSLQDESRAFSTWTPEMREWYEGLMVGDGVSIYPQPNTLKKQKSKLFTRMKKAWKILRGKEE